MLQFTAKYCAHPKIFETCKQHPCATAYGSRHHQGLNVEVLQKLVLRLSMDYTPLQTPTNCVC